MTFSRTTHRSSSVLLAFLLVLSLVLAGPAHGQDGPPPEAPDAPPDAAEQERQAGFSVQPAGPDGPGLRSAFTYNMEPGQTLRDSVSISNLTDEPMTFAISAKDAFNTERDGAFALLADDEEAVDVGSWVTIRVDEYTVPPGRRADIPFELTVPDDAEPGDHAGGILASSAEVTDQVERDGVTFDIRQRVAARIYVRVAGPLNPELRVTGIDIDTDTPIIPIIGGGGRITYTVENLGNVRLATAASVEITGLFGRGVAELDPQDLPELLPGGSVEVTGTWGSSPPIELLTAKIAIESLDGTYEERVSRGFFVWSWLVVALLVLLALFFGYRTWRRRRANRPAPAGNDGTEGADAPGPDAVVEPTGSEAADAGAVDEPVRAASTSET